MEQARFTADAVRIAARSARSDAAAGKIVIARNASFIAPGVLATSFAVIVWSSGLLSSGALPETSMTSASLSSEVASVVHAD